MGGRIILKWICKKWDGGEGMDFFDLAQNRDRCGTFVCSSVPLGSIKCGEFFDYLTASQEGRCSMKVVNPTGCQDTW